MSKEGNKSLIKRDSAFLQKVSNQITITNKLLANTNEQLTNKDIVTEKKERTMEDRMEASKTMVKNLLAQQIKAREVKKIENKINKINGK